MAKDDKNQITIPEDFSGVTDEDLTALHDKAVEAFQAMLPGEGDAPSNEALDALAVLAEGIEAVKGELAGRDAASLARSGKAKELADKVLSAAETAGEIKTEEAKADDEEGADKEPKPGEGDEAKAPDAVPADLVAAGTKKRAAINIDLGSLQSGRKEPEPEEAKDKGPVKVALAAQGAAGFNVGDELTVQDMAVSINSRLGGFNATAYAAARQRRQRLSDRFTIARIPRSFDPRAIVESENPKAAMDFAADEANIPGGQSLVASGGWCAPSETKYEILDISEAENLISTPEIQINRGGVRTTLGPDYRTVFADVGFQYTEEEDIDGDYDGEGGGTKPCVSVPCPDFEDTRLGYSGVCIGAGLLQQRGYPEAIEDYINKTLNAHAHKVSASVINQMVAQSGSVINFPSPQAGATAPLLTAIDLQATHLRAINRMKDDATVEIVLPTWYKAVVRSDLARRLGVDLLDVPDARIANWFATRHVSVQGVVDWQDISTTPAANFTAAPSGISFLLYPAGAFVKGVTDSITLENVYDSVGLGTNDFTALFTEDPYLVLKRLHDTRVVRVPISASGAANIGVEIAANGTFTP